MNTLLWGFLWAVTGWLTGVLVYFVAGFATHLRDDPGLQNAAANYYSEIAMKLLGRAALVERGTNFDIYRTRSIAEQNVDELDIDGNTGHVSNEAGLLSTLHKQPFGLVPPPEDDRAVYVSPEMAELGRRERYRQEDGSLTDDAGAYQGEVSLSSRRPIVRLRENVKRMVPGTRSLWDVDETVELVKQSKSKFQSVQTTEYMILIIAYSAGALLTWIIVTNAGGAAPSGISVPGMG